MSFCKTLGKEANLVDLAIEEYHFWILSMLEYYLGCVWNHVRGNTSLSWLRNLRHTAFVSRSIKCTTHRRRNISQYYCVDYILQNNEKLKKSHARAPRYRRNLWRFFFCFKGLRFDYVTLLECGNCVTGPHFIFVLIPNRGNGSWGNGDHMLVWHDIFSGVYLLPVRARVQVASAIFQVVWIRFLIVWAAVKDSKEASYERENRPLTYEKSSTYSAILIFPVESTEKGLACSMILTEISYFLFFWRRKRLLCIARDRRQETQNIRFSIPQHFSSCFISNF